MENKGVLMGRYEVGRLLGQGTFAKVHYARNLETGMSVAIKIIDKQKVFKVGIMDQIKREISVMRLIKHPNVVELYEVMACKTKIYFVMEYVKGGELFNKLSKGKLKEDAARKHFQHLISAVDYCHSRGVCHRDLKPENLLLDENGNLKVSDFGLSALVESKHEDGMLHTTCGTPAYVAPDVINRKGYDGCKADIWSCGVILFVLVAGYLPFYDSNLMEMYRKIGKGEYKQPSWLSWEVGKLLSKILDPNPATRISIASIMENSWFQKGLGLNCKHKHKHIDVDVDVDVETKRCKCLNAFEIISLSSGLDLSGLLRQGEGEGRGEEVRFASNKSAETIMRKLAECSGMLQVKKREGGLLKLEGCSQGRKGKLSIHTEIFEVTPYFHMVEVKKTSGDSLEYERLLKQDMRPALKDILWTWQGDQQHHPHPHPHPHVSQLHNHNC